MALTTQKAKSDNVSDVVKQIMGDAKLAETERRNRGRFPLFQPVLLEISEDQIFSAFTRDISADGIGLLHWMPISPQDVTVKMQLSKGQSVEIEVGLRWCVSCGDGWYISGGRITSGTIDATSEEA